MTSRIWTWVVALTALAGTGAAVLSITTDSMIQSFTDFEEEVAHTDAKRIKGAFEGALDVVHGQAQDWASWDDAYEYLQDRNSKFEKSNLVTESLDHLNLDYILFLNRDGKIITSLTRPQKGGRAISPQAIVDLSVEQSSLAERHRNEEGWRGVLLTSRGPLLASARPITDSRGVKPSHGWLIFARFGTNLLEHELSRSTRTTVRVISPSSIEGRSAVVASHGGDSLVLRKVPDELTLGVVIRDQTGLPTAVLLAETPRNIMAHGRRVIVKAQLNLAIVGALLSAAIFVLIYRLDRANSRLKGKEEDLLRHNQDLERVVTERTREIEIQAFRDRLTGLANRGYFSDQLKEASAAGEPTAVLFLDLDNFKLVNDSLGHAQGDVLLREVARRLVQEAGEGATVARLGGDEFTILLRGALGPETGMDLAERILESLKVPIALEGREAFASASIGVAWTSGALSAKDILRQADTAMYRAKQAGRSTAICYADYMDQDHLDRLEMETDLRKGLEEGQIFIQYQPLVDTITGEVRGAEALARWRHPARGLVPPSVFVPLAEDTGLINAIGIYVLQQSCLQAVRWMRRGAPAGFFVSVNISGRQLLDDRIVSLVAQALEDAGLPGSCLRLEITESTLIEDSPAMRQRLAGIRALGVRLALDDFGTGFSSLAFLSSFPIDIVKIDRTFISRLGADPGAEAIVQAVCAVARTMSMEVVGEGIETPEQNEAIVANGCRMGQGFLFSRPLDPEVFLSILTEERKAA